MNRRRFTVTVVGGRPAVVAKMAGPDGVAALDHEASLLAAVHHPGVVELVGLHRGADHLVLATRLAGVHTAASAPALGPDRAVRAVGQMVAAVAHLHRCGLCHSRVTPDHVVVDPGGDVRLCGLGLASAATPHGCVEDVEQVRSVADALLELSGRRLGTRRSRSRVRLLDRCQSVVHTPGVDARVLAQLLAREVGR